MSATTTPRCQACQKLGSELKCGACNATYYCNAACQTADLPLHEMRCKFLQNHPPHEQHSIPCVIIINGGPELVYAKTYIASDHWIFSTPPLPITKKIGHPLVMVPGNEDSTLGKNEHATWLTIDPQTGLAQEDCVANAFIGNADGTPLDPDTLKAITLYVNDILDLFRNGNGPPTSMYDRAALDKFTRDHEEDVVKFLERQAALVQSRDNQ